MKRRELNDACVGGPPEDWNKVDVFFDGKLSGDWVEVDAAEGWGIRYVKDAKGRLILDSGHARYEKMTGAFTLRYRES